MLIKVTKDHIKQGIKSDACKCPIALALKNRTNLQAMVFSNIILTNLDLKTVYEKTNT